MMQDNDACKPRPRNESLAYIFPDDGKVENSCLVNRSFIFTVKKGMTENKWCDVSLTSA